MSGIISYVVLLGGAYAVASALFLAFRAAKLI
jgi:Cytochrome B6-F complex subunit VI (PetL)